METTKTATLRLYAVRLGKPPILTGEETVSAKYEPLPHHKAGLSYTATGYGAAIPSVWMVHYRNRWRRVYVRQYGNAGTAYIKAPCGLNVIVEGL